MIVLLNKFGRAVGASSKFPGDRADPFVPECTNVPFLVGMPYDMSLYSDTDKMSLLRLNRLGDLYWPYVSLGDPTLDLYPVKLVSHHFIAEASDGQVFMALTIESRVILSTESLVSSTRFSRLARMKKLALPLQQEKGV